MKKAKILKIVALSVAAAMSLSLFTGCGNKDTAKDKQGRTVISVGEWPSKEGDELNRENEKKARFEEANKDVSIQPDVWKFDVKTFYAKAAGGKLPTLYNTNYTELSQVMAAGYSADLTEVLHKRGYDGMLNKDVLEVVSKDGKIFSFPISAYVQGLGYNTELFEAAGLMEPDGTPKQPKDWDEVVEFAVKIKEKTGKAGIVFPTINNAGGWIFTPLAWSFGTEFMKKDSDGKWKATFNSPECAAALQYIKDLKWKYDVLPQNTIVDGEEFNKIFATGGAAMMITAGDIPRKVVQYGMTPDQLGIMAIPAGPKRHVTLLGGYSTSVKDNATAEQIDAAVRWIEMGTNFRATDEYKKNLQDSLEEQASKNQLIGIRSMSVWSQKAESVEFSNSMTDKYSNSNINHVKLYNNFVADCPAEIQAEEPVCAQELYVVLDGCIQKVLTDKDADCAAILEKANAEFQSNYLDNLDY